MALCAPALWTGLKVDDLFQRAILTNTPQFADYFDGPMSMFNFTDGDPERAHRFMDLGFLPWWTLDTVRLRFLRPVTVLTHWLDYRLWPNAVPLMHIHSLLWLGGLVAVASLLYRRFMGTGTTAGLAALLYAIDDAHGWPAAWLANRNGLLAAFFGFLTLWCHDRWRRNRSLAAAWAAPVCLVLGLLSNEGALAVCGYVFAYAVFVDAGSRRSRALSLVPYAVVVVAWRLVYNALGCGTWGSQLYIDPARSPLRFLKVLWFRAPVLLFGQWGGFPSDFHLLLPDAGRALLVGVAIIFVAWVAWALWPLLRSSRIARFWALGMVLSLLPVCATFTMDRLLLFVGLGAMGLLAMLLRDAHADPAREESAPLIVAWRGKPYHVRTLCALMILVHLVLAPVLMPVRIWGMSRMLGASNTALRAIDLDADVAQKTVVMASAPNLFFVSYLPVLRACDGLPVPGAVRCLAPMSRLPVPIHLTRTDERTLEAEPESGYPWLLVRDDNHPLAVGDRVDLAGMTIEVLSLTEKGHPHRVAFRFDIPLEDPSLVWFECKDGAFVPFHPPPVGESVVLENSL